MKEGYYKMKNKKETLYTISFTYEEACALADYLALTCKYASTKLEQRLLDIRKNTFISLLNVLD